METGTETALSVAERCGWRPPALGPRAEEATWFTRVLGRRSPRIVVSAVERLDEHAGTTARSRVRLGYARGDRGRGPETLFLKVAPRQFSTRVFGGLFQLGATEVRFYEELSARFRDVTPECFGAGSLFGGRRFYLLLEDLAGAGCRFTRVDRSIDAADARAVAQMLASI
ncbi:MAG: hypothetical protein D6815_11930, partial [Candidatus Dadabacteria bacterium]